MCEKRKMTRSYESRCYAGVNFGGSLSVRGSERGRGGGGGGVGAGGRGGGGGVMGGGGGWGGGGGVEACRGGWGASGVGLSGGGRGP